MNVVVDENLPPPLAKGLNELLIDDTVVHLRAKFGAGVSDLEWIGALSREGHWIVLSGDRQITRRKAEYTAFRASRLTGFFLSRGLNDLPLLRQAARILLLWEDIRQVAKRVEAGTMFELSASGSKLRVLK